MLTSINEQKEAYELWVNSEHFPSISCEKCNRNLIPKEKDEYLLLVCAHCENYTISLPQGIVSYYNITTQKVKGPWKVTDDIRYTIIDLPKHSSLDILPFIAMLETALKGIDSANRS